MSDFDICSRDPEIFLCYVTLSKLHFSSVLLFYYVRLSHILLNTVLLFYCVTVKSRCWLAM